LTAQALGARWALALVVEMVGGREVAWAVGLAREWAIPLAPGSVASMAPRMVLCAEECNNAKPQSFGSIERNQKEKGNRGDRSMSQENNKDGANVVFLAVVRFLLRERNGGGGREL
jgi:hypothetical protein